MSQAAPIDFHAEAEALFLRIDRIYGAVDAIDEIERTLRKLVSKAISPAEQKDTEVL